MKIQLKTQSYSPPSPLNSDLKTNGQKLAVLSNVGKANPLQQNASTEKSGDNTFKAPLTDMLDSLSLDQVKALMNGLRNSKGEEAKPTEENDEKNDVADPETPEDEKKALLMELLELLMEWLMGNSDPNAPKQPAQGPSAAPAGGVPGMSSGMGGGQGPAQETAPTGHGGGASSGGSPVRSNSGFTTNNRNLNASLDKIANDPEGSKLLNEARRRGVSIKQGNTPRGVLGQYNPFNNTITVKNGNDVDTVVHELVHAVTRNDGTSKDEEGTANVVAERITARVEGRKAKNPQKTYNSTLPLYPDLQGTNKGFRKNLSTVLSG